MVFFTQEGEHAQLLWWVDGFGVLWSTVCLTPTLSADYMDVSDSTASHRNFQPSVGTFPTSLLLGLRMLQLQPPPLPSETERDLVLCCGQAHVILMSECCPTLPALLARHW